MGKDLRLEPHLHLMPDSCWRSDVNEIHTRRAIGTFTCHVGRDLLLYVKSRHAVFVVLALRRVCGRILSRLSWTTATCSGTSAWYGPAPPCPATRPCGPRTVASMLFGRRAGPTSLALTRL